MHHVTCGRCGWAIRVSERTNPDDPSAPIPMILHCPWCNARHVDEGEFATKPHHTHACQSCGFVWRPAMVATVGVQFLPGFKNEPPKLMCTEHGCARDICDPSHRR